MTYTDEELRDWAEASAAKLIYESRFEIAAALRFARKQGIVEGLREARVMVAMRSTPHVFINERIAEREAE